MSVRIRHSALVVFLLAAACTAVAQDGTLLEIQVEGPSLANNLLGFDTTRDVAVYLPPSYGVHPERRYPVVFVLHGITDPISVWTTPWSTEEVAYGTLPNLMDEGIRQGMLQEMILVMPDARTPFFGCHYANSSVKGNWEDFIVQDLVAFVDAHYRTLDTPEHRGILGHSMGGHGAIRIGMRHPDVFSVVYGLNPSLLGWGGDVAADNPAFDILLSEADPSRHFESNFYVPAIIGVSQAFSPNPENPPFFADYPFMKEGEAIVPNPEAHARWEANFPIHMIEAYRRDGMRLRGLRFDSALTDEFSHIPIASRAFSEALTAQGVPHVFELYNGDHRNRLWGRQGRLYTEVLPYVSSLLNDAE